MNFHRKSLVIILTFLLGSSLVWNAYLYTLSGTTTPWHFLFNAMYGLVYLFGGLVGIFYGFKFGFKSNLGKMLLFLGLGLVCFDVGLLFWVYYNFVLKVDIPFPSWADALFILFYPLMFIGVFYLLKIYQSLITMAVVRDSVIITVISTFLVLGLFSRPDVSADLPLIQKLINIGYPMGDVATLAAALVALRIGGGKLHPSIYIFSFGMLLQTTADLLFTYRNANETYWNGDISDTLYTFSAFFMSVGLFEIINNLQKASPQPYPVMSQSVSPVVLSSTTPQSTQQTAQSSSAAPIQSTSQTVISSPTSPGGQNPS